eukprot:7176301-Prymnesium_polylepis.1
MPAMSGPISAGRLARKPRTKESTPPAAGSGRDRAGRRGERNIIAKPAAAHTCSGRSRGRITLWPMADVVADGRCCRQR